MACLVCETPFLHHMFLPVNPGCKCADRMCQNCCRMGSLTRCPTCRKTSPMTAIDWEMVKDTRNIHPTTSCLGCSTSLPSKALLKHERTCTVYRDWYDSHLHAELAVRTEQASKQDKAAEEMVARIEYQSSHIDDLDELVDDLRLERARMKREYDLVVKDLADVTELLGNAQKRANRACETSKSTQQSQVRRIKLEFEDDNSTDDDDLPLS